MGRIYRGSYNAGELGPSVWGRIDLERFASGSRVTRNAFPRSTGGLVKRPGMEFVAFNTESLSANARLVPFRFNNQQTYMLAVQTNEIFLMKDGGAVLEPQPAGALAIGTDGSGIYVDHAGHGMSAGDVLYWPQGAFQELTGRFVKVAASPAPTGTRMYFEDIVLGTNIMTGTAAFFTAEYGRVYRLTAADGWYATDTLVVEDLDFTQANDKLYISHPVEPTKVLTRTGDTAWTITDFSPFPAVGSPVMDATTPFTGPGAGTPPVDLSYAITALDSTTFEESLATIQDIPNSDNPVPASPVDLFWDDQSDAKEYRVYKSVGGIYGLIGTVIDPNPGALGDALTYQDNGITPNLTLAPPLEANFFQNPGEYPGAVELFQQRIWFGRSDDLLRDIYASRSASLSSFATSTILVEDDPIDQAIVAKSVQEVRYFVPLKNLVIMTSDGEWGFTKNDSGALTPSSGLESYSFWGSAKVKPALVGESAVFVERSRQVVRDLAYSLEKDGFASSDLTLFASHLFAGRTIKNICFAENPYQLLFVVMSDGQAVSCTYVREQQVFAWARHDTSGRILDCASVEEDGLDNIYLHVERSSTSAYGTDVKYRQFERMKMQDPVFLDQGQYLDNSVQVTSGLPDVSLYNPRVVNGEFEIQLQSGVTNDSLVILYGLGGTSLESIEGLSFIVDKTDVADQTGGQASYDWYRLYRHLDGDTSTKELFRWEQYIPSGFRELSNVGFYALGLSGGSGAHHLSYRAGEVDMRLEGSMLLDQTIADDGIAAYGRTAALATLGEVFVSELETLDIDDPTDPITGFQLQISDVLVRFASAKQFYVGRQRDDLLLVDNLETEEEFDLQLGFYRGVRDNLISPGWRRDGRLIIRSEDGFPFNLTAVIPQIQAGDLDVD